MNDYINERKIVRFFLPVVFPEGIAPGDGSINNMNVIALDGQNRHVLRGTALAGVLRKEFADNENLERDDDAVNLFFGEKADTDINRECSKVITYNTFLKMGESREEIRMHNSVDRHNGAVRDKSLFSLAALPAGTEAEIRLDLNIPPGTLSEEDVQKFIKNITVIFSNGLYMGGNKSRGIGFTELKTEKAGYTVYNLSEENGLKKFLSDDYLLRIGEESLQPEVKLSAEIPERLYSSKISVEFTIPRGQDVLIGDSVNIDFQLQAQKTIKTDGETYWRLPGASFKGIFRSWFNRLVALDGEYVADSAFEYAESGPFKSDDIAWCRPENESEREQWKKHPDEIPCPVSRLFGSLYSSSRIFFRDVLIKQSDVTEDIRKHVALSAISGGAVEGSLFDNNVLQGIPGKSFTLTVLIDSPDEKDMDLLKKTLKAIDSGILRIGSSKSAGRLAVKKVTVEGDFSDKFKNEEWLGENPYKHFFSGGN